MGPLVIPAIMAGMYLTKSLAVDKPKEDRQRQLRAEEQRYSPWSGVRNFQQVEEADPFGATLGGAAQGMGLSQSFQKAESDEALSKAMQKKLANNPNAVDVNYNGGGAAPEFAPPPGKKNRWLNGQQEPGMWDDYSSNYRGW